MPEYNYDLDYLGRPRNGLFAAAYMGNTQKLAEAMRIPEVRKIILDTRVRSQARHPLLFIALYRAGNIDTIKLLFQESGVWKYQGDFKKRSMVHYAANSGDPEVLAFLLSKFIGYTVDRLFEDTERIRIEQSFDADKRTAFHALCIYGSSPTDKSRAGLAKCLRILIEHCKSPAEMVELLNEKDNFGLSPLQYASYYGYTEIIDAVKQLEKDYEVLLMPHADQLKVSPDHPGVQRDFYGRTKLMEDAFDNKLTEVRQHLASQSITSDTNLQNPLAGLRSSAHLAVQNAGEKLVEAILLRTDYRIVDGQNSNLAHYAALRGVSQNMRLVLNSKVDAKASDTFGMTPLHVLATSDANMEDRIKCFYMLLQKGADLFATNNNGDTALDVALKYGYTRLANEIGKTMEHVFTQRNVKPSEKMLKAFAQTAIAYAADVAKQKTQQTAAELVALSEGRVVQEGFDVESADVDAGNVGANNVDVDLKVDVLSTHARRLGA
jgi:ankyrin repeat protein